MTSFLDSNVLLYVLDIQNAKRPTALRLVKQGGVINVQVLNEFVDVARRKYKVSLEKVVETLQILRASCDVLPLTLEVHERAIVTAAMTKFRIYDCNIIAAAELAGCDVLCTEDMNHGQRVGGVTIRNPFA